jgi:hypothetical protein
MERVINMSTSLHGTPQWLIRIESPNKRAKLSTYVDGDHQLSRIEDHGGHVSMQVGAKPLDSNNSNFSF